MKKIAKNYYSDTYEYNGFYFRYNYTLNEVEA